jgi:hypothetical protein
MHARILCTLITLAFFQKQHSQYREKAHGVWSMSQLAANSLRHSLNFDEVPGLALTSTQRQIMEILKLNKEQLEHNELSLLQHLEERQSASENYGMPRTAGGGGLHNKQAEAMSYGDVGTLFSVRFHFICF